MIRKAALVGCKEGPWVAIHGLVKPQLRAQGGPGTKFAVSRFEGDDGVILLNLPPGVHDIEEGTFIRVSVLEGNHEEALCDIISGGRRAVRSS
jgi:hypothetical protein